MNGDNNPQKSPLASHQQSPVNLATKPHSEHHEYQGAITPNYSEPSEPLSSLQHTVQPENYGWPDYYNAPRAPLAPLPPNYQQPHSYEMTNIYQYPQNDYFNQKSNQVPPSFNYQFNYNEAMDTQKQDNQYESRK